MRVKIKHILCGLAAVTAFILPSYSASIFSKYGVIQNVQDYSLNPAFNPNSPYNQRLPRPVYAMGPDITTDECLRIVNSLITVQCINLNNCINATVADVRPAVMFQLSRIDTGNYATACSGYIDGVFEEYVAQYAFTAPNGTAATFPTPTMQKTNTTSQNKIKNPYTPNVPEWASEMQERAQELQDLQSQNGTNTYGVTQAKFPATYADLSFEERMKNEQLGYESYKYTQAYDRLDIDNVQFNSRPQLPEYTITYKNVIDGANNPNPTSYNTTELPITFKPATREGFVFKGFFDESDKKQTNIPKGSSGDLTYELKWEPKQEKKSKPEETKKEKSTKPQTNNYICNNPNWEPPVYNSSTVEKGKYGILFQPYTTKQNPLANNGAYQTDTNNNTTFWDSDCSDHLTNRVTTDAPVNKVVRGGMDADKHVDFYLSAPATQSSTPYGILLTDRGWNDNSDMPLRFETEQDALCMAQWLAQKLKRFPTCKNMHIYAIEVKHNITSRIIKVLGPHENNKDDGYKTF